MSDEADIDTSGAERVVECRGLQRAYGAGEATVRALDGVDFDVFSGQFVSLAGPSGSGKSTLLNMIGALDMPDIGHVAIEGIALGGLDRAQRADLRLRRIGFVFQSYNLVPVLSARENVEFVMQLQGLPAANRRERALAVLEELGLGSLAERRPGEMSGGQQQRVAVARALVTEPVLLLADEPSANLDSATTTELLELFQRLNSERGMTIVTATHDPTVMRYAGRRVHMVDGRIERDESG